MTNIKIEELDARYTDFLHDESRSAGEAQSISFPETHEDVCEIIETMHRKGVGVTTQGARTGIVAGAVPHGGHILNLSRMSQIHAPKTDPSGKTTITVQPGVILDDLRAAIEPTRLFFPPDPTESTASIGGMAACNASGALSYHYKPTRNWVESICMVAGDGDVIRLKRGTCFADGRSFAVTTQSGRTISGNLPSYVMPDVKSAAGYYVADNMDMIDLFVGMEGTLGVLTEIELRLIPKPPAICALTIFMPDEDGALQLVKALREGSGIGPAAIEFFNADVLELLRVSKEKHSAFSDIPTLQPHYHTAVYAEFHGEDDEQVEEATLQMMETAMELGGNDEDTWYATDEHEMHAQKAFRHATPEAVNLLIDERRRTEPGLTKLGTDMSVPDSHLESVMGMYREDLRSAGLESVIFGHIGNNHVHVNILPHTILQYNEGRELYLRWAQEVLAKGGSVSAEHGIGKLKRPFLELMYGEEALDQMRELKRLFDPANILNPGNLFE